MIKAAEAAQVEEQAIGDKLAFRHERRVFTGLAQQKRTGSGINFLAEHIDKTEDFSYVMQRAQRQYV